MDTCYRGEKDFAWIKKLKRIKWIDGSQNGDLASIRIIPRSKKMKKMKWFVCISTASTAFTRFSIDKPGNGSRSLLHRTSATNRTTLSECKRLYEEKRESAVCFWDVAVQWNVNFEIEKGNTGNTVACNTSFFFLVNIYFLYYYKEWDMCFYLVERFGNWNYEWNNFAMYKYCKLFIFLSRIG